MRIFPPRWPIAWRLTLLYSLSLFLLLAVAAGILDWTFTSDVETGNKQFIAMEMQNLRTLLKQRPNDLQAWRDEIEKEAIASVSGYAKYYVRILDDHGNTIVETPGMAALVSSDQFRRSLPVTAKKVPAVNIRATDERSFVVASQWVTSYLPEARRRLVQLALDRSNDEDTISDYRRKAAMVLLFGVLFSAGLGVFIARAGLRPLAKLTQVFTRVTPEHLNERVGSMHWPPEIASVAGAFDSMLQRLERSFVLLSHFSADLAHELRTPIGNLRGEAEVALGKSRTAEEYRKVIESSLEEYERLSRVIDNLLFLARADTRHMVARLSPINVRQEMDALLEYFSGLAEEKAIDVSVSGNALLSADPVLFRRALTNLLSNAFQYTLANGRITVDVTNSNGKAQIAIADNGIGIEKACLQRISERFFRTERARVMNSQGSGLGLAIVKSIMDLHSGCLEIESVPGEGTLVRLKFPQA